jgi:hypothetical protein
LTDEASSSIPSDTVSYEAVESLINTVCQSASAFPFHSFAIAGTAALAAFIALLVAAKHRLVAKKRAALDFILTQRTPEFIDAEQTFLTLAEKDGALASILAAHTSDQIKTKLAVQSHLNHWELLAVCVQGNIVDEDICKLMIGDKVCRRWDQAYSLVQEIRKESGAGDAPDDEFFANFQSLAKAWKANPSVKDESRLKKVVAEIARL